MKFSIILIATTLLAFINSQTNPSLDATALFDFSSIPANITMPMTCGVPNPAQPSDCHAHNSMFLYCCHATSVTGGSSTCAPISPLGWLPSMSVYPINGTNYNVNCGVQEGAMGTPCGKLQPTKYTDCTSSSTAQNSCCMYSNSGLGINFCFWAGMSMPVSPIPSVVCTPPSSSSSLQGISYILIGLISLLFFN